MRHGGRAALRESAAIASLQRYDRRGAAGQHRASRRLCGASRERGHRVAVAIRLPWRCRAASCVRENDYSRRSTWGTSPGRRRRAAAAAKTGGTTTRQRTRCSGTSLGSSCVEGRTRPAAPRTTTVANIVASTSSIRRRSASGPSPSPGPVLATRRCSNASPRHPSPCWNGATSIRGTSPTCGRVRRRGNRPDIGRQHLAFREDR